MINFFDLNEEDLVVLNPYDFDKALERLNNLTLDDVKDDLKHFQKKEFEFRTYEEEVSYKLKNIRILTSSKNDKNEDEYFQLKNLGDYLRPFEENDKNFEENKEKKKIELQIKNGERGKKSILLIMYVDPEKLSKNILLNFIKKSEFKTAGELENHYKKLKELIESNNKNEFKFTIKIDMKYINKIYHSKDDGQYYFDLQSPPIFRTNFFNSVNKREKEEQDKEKHPTDENCVFPFRNFEDEFSNLEYRHFIIMIEKETMDTPGEENDFNENFDTNKELNASLENLYKDKNGEVLKDKYCEKKIIIKPKDKNLKDLSYYFNYKENKEIKEKLEDLLFLKKEKEIDEEEEEEEDDDNEKENDEREEENIDSPINENQVIKLFYQILALVSECILSYYNASKFIENLLNDKYRNTIFQQCRIEDFPKFFNLTLNKILDKYQNSLEEKSLVDFENEMKKIFNLLYDQYRIIGMEEIWRPSKNKILKRIQRCVITPSYILFTPYVLEQGNRVLRDYIKSTSDTFLCTFKMDSLGEDKWNNDILVEYIKFILSKGFTIGDKKYRFFNYSQSQFRNMSCWLSTNPEQTIKKLGDFSKVRPLCKYAARISQTLTTTIKTIKIPKDKIENIDDIKVQSNGPEYTFSDGVGKISYILAKKINDDFLKLNYIPSCFQGRFMGCKGVWTTMWDDNSGKIYCRESQKKFDVLPDDKTNFYYFELCDYSRYIQSYLNRQVILLLSALGIQEKNFMKKLIDYRKKLENQRFILSLVHYPEWNKIFNKMYSCGINRANDRLMSSLIESNLDILYDDVKNKARIYIEESAYVKGIMDEYGILNEGEAFLHIKRDNFDLILDKKCVVAKCPCLHPGDLRLLTFKKYNKNFPSTQKYEKLNNYENVIIFPSKGKRPHPNECSGSDLDGDDYYVFYDSDLIPKDQVSPMDYESKSNPEKNKDPYTLNDVIAYFAEYTNYNNLGLIGDAHMAISDKEKDGANSEISKRIAKKFSDAVDAPKTGAKVTLDHDKGEEPDTFPHFMEKSKNKSYHSNNVLGKLYDESNNMIFQRIRSKYADKLFYDEKLKLKGWENYAFLALIYYREYFNEFLNMLKKNEINSETTLLTGNNINNENSIFQKKKNNYDLREKIGIDMHILFLNNQNSFYNAIIEFFIKDIDESRRKINEIDLINISLLFKRNLHLFASSCYMISYNLLEDVLNKIIEGKPIIDIYYNKYSSLINENISSDDMIEEISEISEYDSINMGIDFYEGFEINNSYIYNQIKYKKELMNDIMNKKKKDMDNYIDELKSIPIPKQSYEENQYRILSFPWCIAGNALSFIKYTNF